MSNTQYAVRHLQRGSGNDSGMSCHIERKDAKGKIYVPVNADADRTHFNRELVRFPDGVSNRTEAIQHRIDTAGLRRKVGKNQTKAIRVILTGTHEQMMKIANDGKLDNWINANMKWLKDTQIYKMDGCRNMSQKGSSVKYPIFCGQDFLDIQETA